MPNDAQDTKRASFDWKKNEKLRLTGQKMLNRHNRHVNHTLSKKFQPSKKITPLTSSKATFVSLISI